MRRYELSDEQWSRIRPLLPPERGRWGRPAKENRAIFTGILCILRSGAPWRDVPERYGPWNTIYTRFNRWSKQGVLQKVFQELKLKVSLCEGRINC